MKARFRIPSQIVVNEAITLKVLEGKDAQTHFALVEKNRERLSQWLFWVKDSKSSNDSLEFIRDSRREIENNQSFPYGIWEGEQLIGTVGCVSWDLVAKTVELGAWIDKDHEGKGIVTETLKVLIAMSFDELDTEIVQVFCEPANKKSNEIPRRLGFELVGQAEREHGNETRIFYVYELKRP